MKEMRVCFDFEIVFANGGGLQGQGFRLDIEGENITDQALAAYVIRDLRLLMVGEVRILNKVIIEEPRIRALTARASELAQQELNFSDLSHTIESGMLTYPGLPAPLISDHMSRVQSRTTYDNRAEFQIGRIEMVANTGTYVDTPFHRYAGGEDLSSTPLRALSHLPGVVVRLVGIETRSIDWPLLAATEIQGRAVLIHTGWDRHWRTEQYFQGHPFLTRAAAQYLRDERAALVGIDSLNIDDTSDPERPAHSILLDAGIPIVEHMTRLETLPNAGFTFFATPPKIAGMGSFPVRAHAAWARKSA